MITGIKNENVMTWENQIEVGKDLGCSHIDITDAILRGETIKGWKFYTGFSMDY
ncbi:MAG: hypothetical protein J1E16_06455 [Muribaculaceae bacterium]|nr:hypothetical protein [Muribaculaceae bacterium]